MERPGILKRAIAVSVRAEKEALKGLVPGVVGGEADMVVFSVMVLLSLSLKLISLVIR